MKSHIEYGNDWIRGLTKLVLTRFRELERETKRSIVTCWIPHSKRCFEREESVWEGACVHGVLRPRFNVIYDECLRSAWNGRVS
jgi:hypothetical protein